MNAEDGAAYQDPTAPVEERVDDLLARMTLPEKVGQMLQLDARQDLDDLVEASAGRFDAARLTGTDDRGPRAGAGGPGSASPS